MKGNIVIPIELYELSYQSYKELFSLRVKGGSAKLYNEARHTNGMLSMIASKVVSISYKDKVELTYHEYQNLFDKYLPEVLNTNTISHRMERLRLADYNKALSLCTENNRNLSAIIIERLSDIAFHVINAKRELRDYADNAFKSLTYHPVVKTTMAFGMLWSSTITIEKMAFLWHYSNKDRASIEWSISEVYKQIISDSSDTIRNIFLYSKFEDDINHVSVVFPMKEICFKVDVSKLLESIEVSPQLLQEYAVFQKHLSNYNQSDQL